MNEGSIYSESEKVTNTSRKEFRDLEASIKRLKSVLTNKKIKGLSEIEKQMLKVIVSQAEATMLNSESILSTREFTNKMGGDLLNILKSILGMFRKSIFIIFPSIWIMGYRKEIGNAFGEYLKFAAGSWPKLSLETKYSFLVIAPITALITWVVQVLWKKSKTSQKK